MKKVEEVEKKMGWITAKWKERARKEGLDGTKKERRVKGRRKKGKERKKWKLDGIEGKDVTCGPVQLFYCSWEKEEEMNRFFPSLNFIFSPCQTLPLTLSLSLSFTFSHFQLFLSHSLKTNPNIPTDSLLTQRMHNFICLGNKCSP